MNEVLHNSLIGYSSFKRHGLYTLQCLISFHSFQSCHCVVIYYTVHFENQAFRSSYSCPFKVKKPHPPMLDFFGIELKSHHTEDVGHYSATRMLLGPSHMSVPLGLLFSSPDSSGLPHLVSVLWPPCLLSNMD
jgi:hypothetical protein